MTKHQQSLTNKDTKLLSCTLSNLVSYEPNKTSIKWFVSALDPIPDNLIPPLIKKSMTGPLSDIRGNRIVEKVTSYKQRSANWVYDMLKLLRALQIHQLTGAYITDHKCTYILENVIMHS